MTLLLPLTYEPETTGPDRLHTSTCIRLTNSYFLRFSYLMVCLGARRLEEIEMTKIPWIGGIEGVPIQSCSQTRSDKFTNSYIHLQNSRSGASRSWCAGSRGRAGDTHAAPLHQQQHVLDDRSSGSQDHAFLATLAGVGRRRRRLLLAARRLLLRPLAPSPAHRQSHA